MKLPGRTCKGIKEHLGFNQDELTSQKKGKSKKDNEDNVSGRKRWPTMSNITETSNWTVIGDLCHTVSEEW